MALLIPLRSVWWSETLVGTAVLALVVAMLVVRLCCDAYRRDALAHAARHWRRVKRDAPRSLLPMPTLPLGLRIWPWRPGQLNRSPTQEPDAAPTPVDDPSDRDPPDAGAGDSPDIPDEYLCPITGARMVRAPQTNSERPDLQARPAVAMAGPPPPYSAPPYSRPLGGQLDSPSGFDSKLAGGVWARQVEPVVCTCSRHCGTCYEREAILQWLSSQTNKRCAADQQTYHLPFLSTRLLFCPLRCRMY